MRMNFRVYDCVGHRIASVVHLEDAKRIAERVMGSYEEREPRERDRMRDDRSTPECDLEE